MQNTRRSIRKARVNKIIKEYLRKEELKAKFEMPVKLQNKQENDATAGK